MRWALVIVLLLIVPARPASAEPEPTAPVVSISAPVVDIVFSTADLKRQVRVDRSPRSVRIVVDATVLFGKDSATIRSKAARRLAGAASELTRRGPGRVRVVGYTDDLGSAAHGLGLSRRRARAVAGVLRRDLPAATYRFAVVGRGESDPLVPNTSEANRRINRRVVITYEPG